MIPYGSMSPYFDPWDYFDPDDALQLGYLSAPQYNQIILMMGGRRRRRSLFPCFRRHRRDPYRGILMGGGLGRRGLLSDYGLIPGSRLLGYRDDWT